MGDFSSSKLKLLWKKCQICFEGLNLYWKSLNCKITATEVTSTIINLMKAEDLVASAARFVFLFSKWDTILEQQISFLPQVTYLVFVLLFKTVGVLYQLCTKVLEMHCRVSILELRLKANALKVIQKHTFEMRRASALKILFWGIMQILPIVAKRS